MSNSHSVLDPSLLATVCGGANQKSQAELRDMAQKWCPATYAKYGSAKTLTRAMGEKCLDEAGFGAFKSRLDAYFPPKRGGS